MSIWKTAQRHEDEVRRFLDKMGFQDVDGGQQFKLGTVQVDACGGFEDTLLVIDCHTTVQNKEKSVREKIKALRGILGSVRRGIRKSETYSYYTKIVLILATKRIDVRSRDEKFASEDSPRVHIWMDKYIKYYSDLFDKIGEYAKMELLGELGVKPDTGWGIEYKVPALKARLGGRTSYTFFAEPEVLLRIAYVARREVGEERYYQRILQQKRIDNVAEFLDDDDKKGFFANNIIISFKKKPRFVSYKRLKTPKGLEYGWLHLPRHYRSAWIIDGQHRLYGLANSTKARKRIKLPVLAFHNLPEPQQAELFLTINKEQKPVNPNLLWDLEGEIHSDSRPGVISRVVKKLNSTEPLKGRIYIPLDGTGEAGKHLKIANLCDGISSRRLTDKQTESMSITSKNPLFRKKPKTVITVLSKALSDYYSVVSKVFSKDWTKENKGFFFTNNGMNVMLRVYEHMLAYYKHKPDEKEIRKLLNALKGFYFEKYSSSGQVDELRSSCSSEASRRRTADRFMIVIRRKYKNFAPGVVLEDRQKEDLDGFEKEMRAFVSKKLSLDDEKEWESRVPTQVKREVEKRRKPDDSTPKWESITLGESLKTIEKKENWSDAFEKCFKSIFVTKSRFQAKFEELCDIRNKLTHDRDLRERERELLRIHLLDMRECLST